MLSRPARSPAVSPPSSPRLKPQLSDAASRPREAAFGVFGPSRRAFGCVGMLCAALTINHGGLGTFRALSQSNRGGSERHTATAGGSQ